MASSQRRRLHKLTPTGSYASDANGINSTGQVVGLAFHAGLISQGFLLSNGVYSTIVLTGSTFSDARGINDAGQIVGDVSIGGKTQGFLLSGGVFTTVDVPGASDSTDASGINDAGQIVGTYSLAGHVHGFLLSDGVGSTRRSAGSSTTATSRRRPAWSTRPAAPSAMPWRVTRRSSWRVPGVHELQTDGLPLGTAIGWGFHEEEVEMEPGSSILLYSDGITEVVDGRGQLLGIGGLADRLDALAEASPAEAVLSLRKSVDDFRGSIPLSDDLTLLFVRLT